MNVDEILSALLRLARKDPDIREQLLAASKEAAPVSALCRLSTELGMPLYEMDLISAGEDYYANMRRSTNGGGESSPLLSGEDDYYELFLAQLREI